MKWRTGLGVLLAAAASATMAAQGAGKPSLAGTTKADPAKAEAANVKQLKAKVDTLESQSDASTRELAERDRKIEELRRQLAAEKHQ